MSHNPLVPSYIAEQDALGHGHGVLKATTQFVDISGFTRLTEKLMEHGKEGAEVLAQTLQFNFDPLVRAVKQAGGFITGFAGDAFTAVYPHEEATPVALRVLQASVKMQDFFTQHGLIENQYGSFQFAVKIGLSWGDVEWDIIETAEDTTTYTFYGEGIDGCADSEKHAEKGDIIYDSSFAGQIGAYACELLEGGYRRFTGNFSSYLPAVVQSTPQGDGARFVPEEIANFPRTGEFRRVAVVFLSFDELPSLTELGRYLQRELNRFGGTFTRFDFGDKGGNCLMFFGAPTGHENDEERAVEFALQLMDDLGDTFNMRAGITQNIMYVGFNGGEERYEFACLGRAVTMAARLMMKAEWGELRCGPRIYQRTQEMFTFASIGAKPLKGFAEPVPLYLAKGRKRREDKELASIAMVGREGELRQLTRGLSGIFSGRAAGLFYVDGEAGLGKSYLVASSRKTLIEARGREAFTWLLAPTHQTLRSPFHPFIYALRTFAGLEPSQTKEEQQARFDEAMTSLKRSLPQEAAALAGELVRVDSFLAALLGLQVEGSLYEQLEPRLRFSNTLSAITSWVQALAWGRPLILQLEDGHWLDDASIQALQMLLQRSLSLPIAVVMTNRFRDDGTSFRLALDASVPVVQIDLNRLTRMGLRGIAEAQLGQAVHDDLVTLLEEKAHGNPLFADQIVGYLKEQGALQEVDGLLAPLQTGVILPEEVSSVLIARLDRLEPQIKDIVQVASILGRQFGTEILKAMLADPASFRDMLEGAAHVGIWKKSRLSVYYFVHALMRDAAYDMQARARLRELHKRAAEVFEVRPHVSGVYAELAYHYEQANVIDKALYYLEKAGDEARDNYQQQDALGFYERMLEHMPEAGEMARRVFLSFAQIMQLLGRIDEGLDYCERAAKALDEPAPKVAYQKAFLIQMQGKFDDSYALIEEAMQLAHELGDKEWEARCLNSLGGLSLYKGDVEGGKQKLEQSMHIAHEAGFPEIEVKALSNMAGVALALQKFDEAGELLLQSLEIARQLKDRWTEFLSLGNLGELRLKQGEPEKALAFLESSKKTGEEIGSKNAAFLAHYAAALSALGRWDEARLVCGEAEEIARDSGNVKHIVSVLLVSSEIHIQTGDADAAQQVLHEALTLATSSGQKPLEDKVRDVLAKMDDDSE